MLKSIYVATCCLAVIWSACGGSPDPAGPTADASAQSSDVWGGRTGSSDYGSAPDASYWMTSNWDLQDLDSVPVNGGLVLNAKFIDGGSVGLEAALGYVSVDVTAPDGGSVAGSLNVREDFGVVVWRPDEELEVGGPYAAAIFVDNKGMAGFTASNIQETINTIVSFDAVPSSPEPPDFQVLGVSLFQHSKKLCPSGTVPCWKGACGGQKRVPMETVNVSVGWQVTGSLNQLAYARHDFGRVKDGRSYNYMEVATPSDDEACTQIELFDAVGMASLSHRVCGQLADMEKPYEPVPDPALIEEVECVDPAEVPGGVDGDANIWADSPGVSDVGPSAPASADTGSK